VSSVPISSTNNQLILIYLGSTLVMSHVGTDQIAVNLLYAEPGNTKITSGLD
jgi:hypothetical protein